MTRRLGIVIVSAFAGLSGLIFVFGGDRVSYAQQPKPCAPTLIELGGATTISGALGKASFDILACATGDVLIGQGPGLPAMQRPTFYETDRGQLAIVEFQPCSSPAGSDLPGADVRVAFVSGNKSANATRAFTLAQDTEKPTLTTTSNPKRGTKVDSKQKIVVRMQASEQYGEPRIGWQTGVKKI